MRQSDRPPPAAPRGLRQEARGGRGTAPQAACGRHARSTPCGAQAGMHACMHVAQRNHSARPARPTHTCVVEQTGKEGAPQLPRPVALEGLAQPQCDLACGGRVLGRRWSGGGEGSPCPPISHPVPTACQCTLAPNAPHPTLPAPRTCGSIPHALHLHIGTKQQRVHGGGGTVRVGLPSPGPPLPHLHAAEGISAAVTLQQRAAERPGYGAG